MGVEQATPVMCNDIMYIMVVPEQALDGILLGFGIVVEDKPSYYVGVHYLESVSMPPPPLPLPIFLRKVGDQNSSCCWVT